MVLADNGLEVRLWGHKKEQIDEINSQAYESKVLERDRELPESINGYHDLGESLDGVDTIILAVPTKAIRGVLGQIQEVQVPH